MIGIEKKKRTKPKAPRASAPKRRNAEPERLILQIIPADPGWHALYCEEDDGPMMTMPLVCFGLVELRQRVGRPMRFVFPMVMHENGAIDDVNRRDGFVELIPPCMHDVEHSADDTGDPAVDGNSLDEGNREVRHA